MITDVLTEDRAVGRILERFSPELGRDRVTGHWQVVDRLGVFQQLRRFSEAEG